MIKKPRVTIDDEIAALIPILADCDYNVKMSQHQQNAFYSPYLPNPSAMTAGMLTTTKLSINDIIDLYVKGGTFYLADTRDYIRIYEAVHKYVALWAKRSHVMVDDPLPPIEDFVNMDDFLSKIFPDYVVVKASEENYKPYKAPKRTFRRRLLDDVSLDLPEHKGVPTGRYVSLMDQFHARAWENAT